MKNRGQLYSKSGLLTLAAVMVTASGCAGNFGGSKGAYAPKSSVTQSGLSRELENTSDFACPNSENVTRYHDPYADGSGKYEVCVSRSNSSIIKITGKSHSTTGKVCLIPANDFDTIYYYGLRNSSGAILYRCIEVSENGVGVDLSTLLQSKKFNLMHAVEPEELASMLSCLYAYNANACPSSRSYGRLPVSQ